MDGGIFGLLGLIRDHRGALEYDFRHRFNLSLSAIGPHMTLTEAARLVRILRSDPSSMTASAMEGWKHPISHETVVLADLYDLEAQVHSKGKPKPHNIRPWETGKIRQHKGDAAGRTPEETRALLARARAGTAS